MRPSVFSNLNILDLGIDYDANLNAWINGLLIF